MKKAAILLSIFFLSLAILAQWSNDPAINTSIYSGSGENRQSLRLLLPLMG